MRPTSLFRSAAWRYTALYASVYLASTLLLLAVLFAIEVQSTRETARLRNAATLAWLHKEYESGGVSALRAAIARSIALPVPARAYFRLATVSGRELVSTMPGAIAAEGEEEIRFATEDGAAEGAALVQTIPLGGGYLLSAGRDVSRLVWTQWLFTRAALSAIAGSLLLGTLVGAAMGWGIFRRIGAMNRLIEEITRGDLGQRLAVSGRGDELDETAANFNRMLDMVQRLMGDLRHVANNIAHDLRTPLMRLERRLEEISATATSGSREAGLADDALAEANQILEIFNALLRIAQIEAGGASAIFETVDLSAVVRTIEDAYLPLAEEEHRAFTTEVQAGVCVRGDRSLLLQLLANLIENVLNHTPGGTPVSLALCQDQHGVTLSVGDRGPGIPPDMRARVFERFFRLEKSRTTRGSGLGLSLVAAIARAHDATIALDDNAPGLRVTLRFPSVT